MTRRSWWRWWRRSSVPSCPWWDRWQHQKQRDLDRAFLLPSMVEAATRRRRPMLALVLWDGFLEQVGQDHWHCPCGIPDRERTRQRLIEDVTAAGPPE